MMMKVVETYLSYREKRKRIRESKCAHKHEFNKRVYYTLYTIGIRNKIRILGYLVLLAVMMDALHQPSDVTLNTLGVHEDVALSNNTESLTASTA